MNDGKSKSQRTKEALAESYRALLSERPTSKISIADITRGCGVSTPTFYNHFSDRYALTVWMYVSDGSRIMEECRISGKDWRETLLESIRYYADNRDFILNALVHMGGKTQFMSIMEETNIELLNEMVRSKLEGNDTIPADVVELIKIYCLGNTRYIYNWLIADDPLPPESVADLFMDCIPFKLRHYLQ